MMIALRATTDGDTRFPQRTTELSGHAKKVQALDWTPDGRKLASGDEGCGLRVHDVEHGAGAKGGSKEFKGHEGGVEQVKFDPARQGGDRFASVSSDKTLRIWDVRSGKCTNTVKTNGELINVAWSPSGNHIVVGNSNDLISVVDVKTMKVVWEQQYKFEINQLAWSKKGDTCMMATGSGKLELNSFDAETGALTSSGSHFAHNGGCYSLAMSNDGKRFAMGAADAVITLWEMETMFCYTTIVRVDNPIRTLSFSHDDTYVAAGSEDLRIDVGYVKNGKCAARIETTSAVNSVAFNPKEFVLAYSCDGSTKKDTGKIHLWSAFTGMTKGKK